MKFDFYTGAIDFTGIGSDFGHGNGIATYEPFLHSKALNGTAQGKANGKCDKMGNNYG